jgi:hypothetical protein
MKVRFMAFSSFVRLDYRNKSDTGQIIYATQAELHARLLRLFVRIRSAQEQTLAVGKCDVRAVGPILAVLGLVAFDDY